MYELQQMNNMEKAESSAEQLHACTELFSIRQYVFLSRQKNLFQNWPFSEKHLKSCLEYGVTTVLPPLEARGLHERTSISYDKENIVTYAGNHDHEVSVKSEQIHHQLVTLSCNDQKHEQDTNPSNMISSGYRYMDKGTPVNPCVTSAREGKKTRKWRRKMKTMSEIFATAKHCTLEEFDDLNDFSCSSVTAQEIDRKCRRINKVDFEYYDSKSEVSDDGADCCNRLSKRLSVLKSWSRLPNSSYKSTNVITKNRTKGCNRRARVYDPRSSFELQGNAYMSMLK